SAIHLHPDTVSRAQSGGQQLLRILNVPRKIFLFLQDRRSVSAGRIVGQRWLPLVLHVLYRERAGALPVEKWDVRAAELSPRLASTDRVRRRPSRGWHPVCAYHGLIPGGGCLIASSVWMGVLATPRWRLPVGWRQHGLIL